MHPHAELITRFYTAFQQRDAATMATCYHRDLTFQDEAFGPFGYDDTVAMWTMLCARGKDLALTFRDVAADDTTGRAHWEARYTFSQTGRHVHNRIDASFRFQDGLIVAHRDHFDFWRWSRQALGAPGMLLGWSPWLRGQVQQKAMKSLRVFQKKAAG